MALPSSVDIRFDARLGARVREMAALAAQAQGYVLSATVNIARAAAKRAAQLTPRSPGPGPHIADGWRLQQIVRGGDVTVRVYNADPRASEPLELADGSRTPYTLLDILEYGSDPHVIAPVNGPTLTFFWPKVGAVVRSKEVHHPGTRAYAMVQLASVRANVDLKRAFDALRVAIRLAMLGKASRLSQPNPFGGN